MKGFIYIIKNDVNDKVYIGQTIHPIEKRWLQHKRNYKYAAKNHKCHLFRAFSKYGIKHFSIEMLEEIEAEREMIKQVLNEKEIYYIAFYDSFQNGYNSTLGGGGLLGKKGAEASASKAIVQYDYDGIILGEWDCLAEAALALNIQEDVIRRCAKHKKPYCRKSETVWRWKSEPFSLEKNVNRVLQYDKEGNLIKRWYSLQAIGDIHGYTYTKNVSRVCLGNKNTFDGFIWKYERRI